MKVSIITPTFNSAKTIVDTLYSINKQSYDNIEHILVDGKSTDETVELCKKYSPNSIIISENDFGIYDAMNKGVLLATGDIICILNSDDLYSDNNVIQEIVSYFEIDSGISIIYGDLVYVKSEDTNFIVRKWKSKPYYNFFFENGNVPPHPTVFVRNCIYKDVGLFDLEFKFAADYELMLRIFKNHDFNSKYIQKVIVKMRLGGATNKNFLNIISQNIEILKAWRKNNLSLPPFLMVFRFFKRLNQFFVI